MVRRMRIASLILGVVLSCTSAKESARSGAEPAASTDGSRTATADAAPVSSVTGLQDASTAAVAAPGPGRNSAREPAATDGGTMTTETSPGLTTGSSSAGASASRTLTASEAAASYAKSQAGAPAATPAAAEDNSCQSDADCAFTRIDAGACCPLRCSPRVVSKKQADALQAHVNSCRKGQLCPEPMCRPPPFALTPSCQQHQCVGKPGRASSTDD
jgi:hypothetical protein